MIRNYDGLALAREQLTTLEKIIISTHRELWDANRRNYYIYADGAIEMMLKIRAEIDEFLGIDKWSPDTTESVNGAPAEHAAKEPAKP